VYIMTNEELAKRYFTGRFKGNEESYSLSIKSLPRGDAGSFALYSRANTLPLATKVSEKYFLISIFDSGSFGGSWKKHIDLATNVAEQLNIKLISAPHADRLNFHAYMERKINNNLLLLAERLEKRPPGMNYEFYPPYKELIKSIRTLLDGEIRLGLPKNQVALLDDHRAQTAWEWLIKENPIKEEWELLLKMYTLNRLLAPKQSEFDVSMSVLCEKNKQIERTQNELKIPGRLPLFTEYP